MREIKVGNNTVAIYSHSKEMTINRYTEFQKYLLLDTGVGSSMESISNHFSRLHSFAVHKQHDNVVKEAENLHMNFYSVLNGINFQALAFGCMVHAINESLCTDITEEGLTRLRDKLNDIGLTQEIIEAHIADVKKKIHSDLKLHYPEFFPDDDDFQFYEKVKQSIALKAEMFDFPERAEEIQEQLDRIESWFAGMQPPQNFRADDNTNAAVMLALSYANLCALLEANGMSSPGEMSLMDFYARLSYLKKSTQKKPA